MHNDPDVDEEFVDEPEGEEAAIEDEYIRRHTERPGCLGERG